MSAEAKVGVVVALGLVVGFALHHAPKAAKSPSFDPIPQISPAPLPKPAADGARRVIASAKIVNNRCNVPGSANGLPVTYLVDTGNPDAVLFPSGYIGKLGLNPATLHYTEFWPGTRYGKIAQTTLPEIRIGNIVWRNEPVHIYQNWNFSFGDETNPLFGLAELKKRGVHVEIDGDICRLTVAVAG